MPEGHTIHRLVGVFRSHATPGAEPGPATRLRLAADGVAVDLAGPMACELLDPAAEQALRGP